MTWDRVREVFSAALGQPAERRDVFVVEACGSDDALRVEVASLLAAHAGAGGFLESPAVRFVNGDVAVTMGLQPGQRVGDFEVLALLGSGGMGEVYRARDSRLGRDVAIKLLPPTFASDPRRLARFERESRILASLNHPNIASIHSVERIDGLHLLVLELVEGPTLADRLKDGAVPLADALAITRQLTEALEAAHDRGIVHRDLKPSNVKLAPSGRVVLLDFGLAKEDAAFEQDSPGALQTSAGVILGSCAYMSPEQARGRAVDKRTDIWAFGCILFELLSGERAFRGDTPSDTFAAVLERQPDWSALPENLPTSLRSLLRRSLEKDMHRRLHDIADARLEIDDALQPVTDSATGSPARRRPTIGAILAGAAVLTAVAAGLGWWARAALQTQSVKIPVTRLSWLLPADLRLESPPVVSPDGRHVVIAASAGGAPRRLYVRQLSGLELQPIPRTEGAMHPFWSPDSRALGYFAGGKLMKVAIEGGAPVEICAAVNPRGGAWGNGGVIVFAPDSIYSGLSKVSAAGGRPEAVTLLDGTQGENAHRWPAFLPDGIHFVYFVRSTVAERRGVYLGRTDREAGIPAAPLFRSESEAVYVPLDDEDRGVLLNAAEGHVEVHPFDTRRYSLVGDPTTISLRAGGNTPHHAAMLSAAGGVLAHVSIAMPYGQRLVWAATSGERGELDPVPGILNWPRLSPDGTRIVSQRVDAITGSPDLWVQHLQRGTRVRVTQENASGQLPVWSPDGASLAYVAGPSHKPVLTIAAADGSGVMSTVPCPRVRCEPTDWSRDGSWLLVTALDGASADVWMLPTVPGGVPRPLLIESYVERDARFSPDGRLVAYISEEVGRPEIWVRTIEGTPRREIVSVGGGTQPVWSRNSSELLFVDPAGSLQKVALGRTVDGRPVVTTTTALNVPPIGAGQSVRGSYEANTHNATQFDVSPDGRKIYYIDRRVADAPREIGFVLGWRELLKGSQ